MQPNRSFVVCALLFVLAGCSKSLRTLEDDRFTTLNIKAQTIDVMGLRVTANDTVLTTLMETPQGSAGKELRYKDPTQRIRVFDVYANVWRADTTISLKLRGTNSITFFQSVPGGKLEWIGPPPASEPLPHNDSAKMSIIYTLPGLPDRVKVVVENSIGNTNVYMATDSFLLERGKLSRYFSCKNSYTGRLQLKFYTPDVQRTPVASVIREEFIGLSSDFYVYGFREVSGGVNNVPTLRGERFY
jgi:hypothetical protein